MTQPQRRLPVGAESQSSGGVHFRVWAPDHRKVSAVIERDGRTIEELALSSEPCGYLSGFSPHARVGDRYRFRLGDRVLADPASRFQPDGPFGASEIVDPLAYRWNDSAWRGRPLEGQVIYEMHCGTFTQEGTWQAAAGQLPHLADLGITMVELMPVAEFPGRFGWGYDGVFPFAPTRLYGNPDDLRAFVDRAHELHLCVVLDVVYNHLGPDGCVFREYAQDYYTRRYANEWGEALNFDGAQSWGMREYFIANAGYWIEEYHADGLRLDATQAIHDASSDHLLAAIGRRAREAAGPRTIVLIAENEGQQARLAMPVEEGGYGLDALWNDDFHHSAIVAVTGRREAYYSDHRGTPQELISAARHGYLFQGQRYAWQEAPRGTDARTLGPATFVNYIENHDQVANTVDGARLHRRTSPGRYRALTALFLLLPGTPMLFQGQEMAASSPFLYFADHKSELAAAVQQGRRDFLAQFPSTTGLREALAPPHDPETFRRCKLRWEERERHAEAYRLHVDLLGLRRREAAFRRQARGAVDGAVLGPEAFLLRFAGESASDDRLLIVNFGADIEEGSFAEPLLAPPHPGGWSVIWSSEHPHYGGTGTPVVSGARGWHIPGHAAVALAPEPPPILRR